MNTQRLSQVHPAAYAALPEPYREDDCLLFWQDREGILHATPKQGQVDILGDWEMTYWSASGWVQST